MNLLFSGNISNLHFWLFFYLLRLLFLQNNLNFLFLFLYLYWFLYWFLWLFSCLSLLLLQFCILINDIFKRLTLVLFDLYCKRNKIRINLVLRLNFFRFFRFWNRFFFHLFLLLQRSLLFTSCFPLYFLFDLLIFLFFMKCWRGFFMRRLLLYLLLLFRSLLLLHLSFGRLLLRSFFLLIFDWLLSSSRWLLLLFLLFRHWVLWLLLILLSWN